MTADQEAILNRLCTRFGCVYRHQDYHRLPDGSVEGWCGGTPRSGFWLRVPSARPEERPSPTPS